MNIRWSPTAKQKIQNILEYISADNQDAALALIDDIEERARKLKGNPMLGRKVPALKDENVRETVVRKFYMLVYEIKEEVIEILTVRHTRKDIDNSSSIT